MGWSGIDTANPGNPRSRCRRATRGSAELTAPLPVRRRRSSCHPEGKLEEAILVFQSIIAAWEKTGDEYVGTIRYKHVADSVAFGLREIALIYHDQVSTRQRPHTAEPRHPPPARRRGACAPPWLSASQSLGFLLASQGKFAAAEPLYKKILAVQEKVAGGSSEHASTLGMFADLKTHTVRGCTRVVEPPHAAAIYTG